MPTDEVERVKMLLQRFITGEDQSLALAGDLEGALTETFAKDERFEDLLDALASYRPGGGPYLYNESQLVLKCQAALSLLI